MKEKAGRANRTKEQNKDVHERATAIAKQLLTSPPKPRRAA